MEVSRDRRSRLCRRRAEAAGRSTGDSRWSDAVRVCLHPDRAYDDLPAEPRRAQVLAGPIDMAVLLGVVFAVVDSGRPTLRLVLGCAAAWSFVPALQIASIAALRLAFAKGRVSLRRAIRLHFLGHLPWSAWLLFVAAIVSSTAPAHEWRVWGLLSLTAPVPFLWSRIIGWHFFRRVFGLGRTGALLATALHVVLVGGSIAAFFLATGQLGPRLAGGR